MSAAVGCDMKAEAAETPVRVRSARELFRKLSAADDPARFSVLDAVRLSPEAALSFGIFEGRDVIDVLLQNADQVHGHMEWFRWIGALAAFRAPRVVRLFISLLLSEKEGELLFAAAQYLRSEPVESIHAEVASALMQNESAVRARAAADVIASSLCLSVSERLRIGLLQETGPELPGFLTAPAEWLAELNGPFRSEAYFHLERQGQDAIRALAEHWDQLSEGNREWLIEWSSEQSPSLSAQLVRRTLRHSVSDRLSLAALQAATLLGPVADDLDDLIRPYLSHPNETMRCAAAKGVSSGVDWRAVFQNESSLRVKGICLRRMPETDGLRAIPDLLHHLQNADWRIRAAAADGLATLGAPGAREAIALLPEADDTVRAAIARVLLQFGDEDMLDECLQKLERSP